MFPNFLGGSLVDLSLELVHEGHDALVLDLEVGDALLALKHGAVVVPEIMGVASPLTVGGVDLPDNLPHRETTSEEDDQAHIRDKLQVGVGSAHNTRVLVEEGANLGGTNRTGSKSASADGCDATEHFLSFFPFSGQKIRKLEVQITNNKKLIEHGFHTLQL